MPERSNETLIGLALPRRFKWAWLIGLLGVGSAFIVLAALHKTFPDLIITFAAGLAWILMPLAILLTTLVRRYGFKQAIRILNFGLSGEDAEAASRVPTVEDKQSFLATAKNSSMVTLATTTGAEDLCPICLDEEDMGDPLITLRCGHVFHEKCIDSVIDTAYEKMYAPNYLGLPILPRDQVLSSLRCPLCRSQMTEVNDNDIEDGVPQPTTTETPSGSSVNDDNAAGPSNGGRPLSRAPTVFNLSDLGESSPSHLSSYVPTSIGTTVIQM